MNVFLIAAITADGFIAEATDQISTAWTSKEDKKFFSERTKQAGVIVMGATTFQTIGRALPERLNIVYTKDPTKLPLDTYDQKQLRATDLPPAQLLQELEAEGFTEVAICGGASIYSLFLQSGLINKLYLTLEPVLFGKGIKLLADNPVEMKLKLISDKHLSENTLLLEYDVLK